MLDLEVTQELCVMYGVGRKWTILSICNCCIWWCERHYIEQNVQFFIWSYNTELWIILPCLNVVHKFRAWFSHPQFFSCYEKCEIWRRFSSQSTLWLCGFETKQIIWNLKYKLEVPDIYPSMFQIWCRLLLWTLRTRVYKIAITLHRKTGSRIL